MFWNRARNQVLSFLLKIQQLTTSHFFIFLWIKLTSFLFFGICVSVPNKNDDSQNPVKKKTRVFCWSSVSGFIGQPFLGGNSTKKSARFRFQKGMKIALSLTTHFVKTTWRLDHTLWSVGSSCWWIWMGFWPIDHDKKNRPYVRIQVI